MPFRRREYRMPNIRSSLLVCVVFLCIGAVAAHAAEPPVPPAGESGFRWIDALVLGVVEGVTEYLPVSSTGHLLLAQHLMGLSASDKSKQAADAYAIIIQIGAILAVLGLYRRRIGQMILGLLGRNPGGANLLAMLLIGFMPAAVVGLALGDTIKTYLFGPWPVVVGWLVGGLAILARPWEKFGRRAIPLASVEDICWRQALTIGALQILALWPGVSRSLTTIVGGMIAGLEIAAAVEFSFLLGLVTLGAATVYEMLDQGRTVVTAYGIALPMAGIICSLVSAWLSVKWLVGYLKRSGLVLFGYYRVFLALITGMLLIAGVL
jgi:undecaprenyl-diphosphatase